MRLLLSFFWYSIGVSTEGIFPCTKPELLSFILLSLRPLLLLSEATSQRKKCIHSVMIAMYGYQFELLQDSREMSLHVKG